jgi:hypothetical protein
VWLSRGFIGRQKFWQAFFEFFYGDCFSYGIRRLGGKFERMKRRNAIDALRMVTVLLLIRIRDTALKLEVSHAAFAGAIIGWRTDWKCPRGALRLT